MLHHVIKCAYKNCGEIFDKAKFPRKQYCSRRCQSLALYQLEQHTELIRTVDAVNKLGSGMALVRFGILSDPLIFSRRERGLEQGEEFWDGSVLMQ